MKVEEIDSANEKLEEAAIGRVALHIISPYIKNELDILMKMNIRRFRDGQLTERLALDAFAQMAALNKILLDVERQINNSKIAMESLHNKEDD